MVSMNKKFITKTQVINLSMKLEPKQGKNYTTLKQGTYDVLSISGSVKDKSPSGRGRPSDNSWGQVYDSIKSPTPQLRKIIKIWKQYHLNDLTAGTKKQEDALKRAGIKGGASDFDNAVNYLKNHNLSPDRGYSYGGGWLIKPIPSSVKKEIIRLFR